MENYDQTLPPPPMDNLPKAEVEQKNAGFWYRLFALLIDSAILGTVSAIITLVFGLVFIASSNDITLSQGSAVPIVALIPGVLSLIIAMSYFICLHGLWGQTLGKKMLRLKVVNLDKSPISFEQSVIRYAPYLVFNLLVLAGSVVSKSLGDIFSFVLGLFVIASGVYIAINKQKRAPHDLLAKTMVINL